MATRGDFESGGVNLWSILVTVLRVSSGSIPAWTRPSSFYLHPSDILVELDQDEGHTWCEWKGKASYFVYKGLKVAWRYENPSERFARIDGWYSFYPGKASCFVYGEPVKAQIGQFYGGWITNEIVGPFKGGSGTNAW
jgi:hypothetical protein